MAGWSKTGPTREAGAAADLHPLDRLHLAWRLFRDPRVSPRVKKWLPTFVALYVLSPVDLIPDFLLGLGQVDDIGVIGLAMAALTLVLRFAPSELVAEHLAAMGLWRDQPTASTPPSGGVGRVVDANYRVRT